MKKLLNNKGITLVELMVSVFLFAVGLAAIFAVCLQSMASARHAEGAYTAYNLAKNHIETLKAMNFTDLASAAETATVLDQTGTPDLNGSYTRSTTIVPNYQGRTDLIQVTTTVYYKVEGQQSANPMTMATVINDTTKFN